MQIQFAFLAIFILIVDTNVDTGEYWNTGNHIIGVTSSLTQI